MTDLQWVLSIGIPSLLVLLSWIQNNTRLTGLEASLDTDNRRIDKLQRSQHSDTISLPSEMGRVREARSMLHERMSLPETAQR